MPNEEFEQLMREQNPKGYLARADNGEYIVPGIQKKWEGYQLRQPEIDALNERLGLCEIILDNRNEHMSTLMDANKRLAFHNRELQAEVERLRADAERLDFFIRTDIELRVNDDFPEEYAVFRVTGYPNDREWTHLSYGNTARDAIDAAMREMK